jgi:hypothetical protein
MGIYSAGTVSVTNASKTVTGAGTAFAANVKQGDTFSIPTEGFVGFVDIVTDDTHLELKHGWGGATAGGQTYAINQTGAGWNPIVAFNATMAEILAKINSPAWADHPGATDNPHSTTLIQAATALGLAPIADTIPRFVSPTAATLDPLTAWGRQVIGAAGALPGKAWVDVASSASPDIGAAASNFVRITGTVNHGAYTNATVGTWRVVMYASGLTLLNNAASFILPANSSLAIAAGDVVLWYYEAVGVWRALWVARANGRPVRIYASDLFDATANAKTLMTLTYAQMWTALGGGTLGQKNFSFTPIAAPTVSYATLGSFAPVYGARGGFEIKLSDYVLAYVFMTFNANAFTGASGALKIEGFPSIAADDAQGFVGRVSKLRWNNAGHLSARMAAGTNFLTVHSSVAQQAVETLVADPTTPALSAFPPSAVTCFIEAAAFYRATTPAAALELEEEAEAAPPDPDDLAELEARVAALEEKELAA